MNPETYPPMSDDDVFELIYEMDCKNHPFPNESQIYGKLIQLVSLGIDECLMYRYLQTFWETKSDEDHETAVEWAKKNGTFDQKRRDKFEKDYRPLWLKRKSGK